MCDSLDDDDTATIGLKDLCRRTEWHPDLEALRMLVANGGNVMARVNGRPILTHFFYRDQLEAALACLNSPRPMDFTVMDNRMRTPLHAIAAANAGLETYNRTLIQAVVQRLETHPEDMADWGCGEDLLSIAAENQILHVIWREVKGVPYFADKEEPIPLLGEVWEWDWKALDEAEHDFLSKDKAACFHRADLHTARLWKFCTQFPSPDLEGVRQCVAAGADVMYKAACENTKPILTHYLQVGSSFGVLEALLNTDRPIDFTTQDGIGESPVHQFPWFITGERPLRRLLHVIHSRVCGHPEDTIDWGAVDFNGETPISSAASSGYLSTWVKVLFHELQVPYYIEYEGKIPITENVERRDWNKMTPEDQARFALPQKDWRD